MKADLEELENNKVLLKIEVPVDDVSDAIKEAYKVLAQKVNVPGFRKGRIPAKVIDSQLGKGSVYNEALQTLVPHFYTEAVKESGVKPITNPHINILQISDEKTLKFNATVEVKPPVKLGNYKKIKIKKKPTSVSKKAVTEQLDFLRDKFSELEVVGRRKQIKKGDFVLIDFEGLVDGKPFQGGSAKDYLLEIGSGAFLKGFEDQLVGVNKGEVQLVNIDVPSDYPGQEIAGKKTQFKVTIKEIKTKKLPKLDDDFAKAVSEFDTLEGLKKSIAEKIKNQKEREFEGESQAQVLKEAVEGAKVDVPKVLVDREVQERMADFEARLKESDTTLDDYLKSIKSDLKKLKESFTKEAEQRVKNTLVLEAIAEKENVKVSEVELNREIKFLADQRKVDFKEYKKILEQRGVIDFIEEDLLYRNTIAWLTKEATKPKRKQEKPKEDQKREEKEQKK